jgi:hypothetical protein
MKGLDVPVNNKWGLRPARTKDTGEIAPLSAFRDFDKLGLANVPTLNFHPHLPHYEITDKNSKSVQLLARQPIDLDVPHPFTAAGNTEFNCLLWMAPDKDAPATSSSSTQRTSPRYSVGRLAFRTSGGILLS